MAVQYVSIRLTYSSNLLSSSQQRRRKRVNLLSRRPVESHSGARGNIFVGPLWGKNVLNFLLKMAHSSVLYILERRGPPNVAGPEVTYPLTPPISTGLLSWRL